MKCDALGYAIGRDPETGAVNLIQVFGLDPRTEVRLSADGCLTMCAAGSTEATSLRLLGMALKRVGEVVIAGPPAAFWGERPKIAQKAGTSKILKSI